MTETRKQDAGAIYIKYLPLSTLRASGRNPKRHDLIALSESFSRFGYVAPMILDERTGLLVAGHGRLDALRQTKARGAKPPGRITVDATGEWLIPVVHGVAFASEVDAEGYLLTDNQQVLLGDWDDEELARVLADLQAQDGLYGTGFDAQEMLGEKNDIQGGTAEREIVEDEAVPLSPAREYVVIVAESEVEWERLRTTLGLRTVRRGGYAPESDFAATGLERVIPAARLLAMLSC